MELAKARSSCHECSMAPASSVSGAPVIESQLVATPLPLTYAPASTPLGTPPGSCASTSFWMHSATGSVMSESLQLTIEPSGPPPLLLLDVSEPVSGGASVVVPSWLASGVVPLSSLQALVVETSARQAGTAAA